MQKKRLNSWVKLVLVMAVCALPGAATVLYSDLGTGLDVYNANVSFSLAGSGSVYGFLPVTEGESSTFADLFTVAGTGSFPVSEIDLAVSNILGTDTFYASIWTDDSGQPGSQVSGAFWDLTATTTTCCSLISITGISDVTLVGGDSYFLVLGPQSVTDDSWNGWDENSTGTTGLVLQSDDGGSIWVTSSSNELGAFDVLDAPEPSSWFLIGFGIAALMVLARFRRKAAV